MSSIIADLVNSSPCVYCEELMSLESYLVSVIRSPLNVFQAILRSRFRVTSSDGDVYPIDGIPSHPVAILDNRRYVAKFTCLT